MNILFINKKNPFLDGGAEKRILYLSKYLIKNGHNVSVLFSKTVPTDKTMIKEGIRLYCEDYIPNFLLKNKTLSFYLSKILFYILPSKTLTNIIKYNNIDVAIIDSSPSYNLFFSQKLEQYNVKTYYTVHNVFFTINNWIKLYNILGPYGYFLESKLLRNKYNKKIITVAKWVQREIIIRYNNNNTFLIPNGIDTEYFKPEKKKNNIKIIILNVGRFTRHKDHKTLIYSFKKVVDKNPNIELHLAGDGPLILSIKAMVEKLQLNNKVIFYGNIPSAEISLIYNKADIFILSSKSEGSPIVVQEAMSMGLPIISTRIPAIEGILNDKNAILCKVDDPEDMAKKMEILINNRKMRKNLSDKMRKQAVSKFNWERLGEQFLNVITYQ